MREWLVVVTLLACGLAALAVRRRSTTAPLWVAVLLAIAVRCLVAVIARPFTPADVAFTFESAGRLVGRGVDPALGLARYQWNFLPVMPLTWSGLRQLGLPWLDVVRVPPILCDALNVWLVGLLAIRSRAATSRLVYALHPVAIIVAALHAQVEPVALSALLGGLVFLKRERQWEAGSLFGLAIAIKTWPAAVVLAILAPRFRRSERAVLATVLVPLAFFVFSIAAFGSPPRELADVLTSYSSYVGYWGWGGTVVAFGDKSALGYDSSLATIGTVLTAAALVGAIVVFRRTEVLRRCWAVLLSIMIVSAGWATQYLVWPVPFLVADDEDHALFAGAATVLALVSYLPIFPGDPSRLGLAGEDSARQPVVTVLSWIVIATMAQLVWRAVKRRSSAEIAPAVD
jgi:hypothetical protein